MSPRRASVTTYQDYGGSSPDDWQFPVGTEFWKEFFRDGVRIETRWATRIGNGLDQWAFVAYV